jgi:hypothetical protein
VRGFGSPSSLINGTPDLGFGSPSDLIGAPAVGDHGFGSAVLAPGAEQVEILPYYLRRNDWPDDGGHIVRVFGSWPSRGPWRVRLTPDAGATLYPLGKVGCYSGIIGQGHLCYTTPSLRTLAFVLPPLPLGGPYDLWIDRVFDAAAVAAVRVIVSDITVVVRAQAEEVYSARQTMPPLYLTGPRSWALEDLTLPTLPTAPIYTITRALGQVAQQAAGSPQTRLIGPLVSTDTKATVETTIGFPDVGEVWIGPRRYSYASRGATDFVGIVLLTASDALPLAAKTEVTLHAPAYFSS